MSERETALKEWTAAISCAAEWSDERWTWADRVVPAGQALAKIVAALPPGDAPQTCEWRDVWAEVQRATTKFPTWPTDPLHALAVLGEEFGELTKATVQQTYEPHKNAPGELRKEAIQTAAMAMRFVMSLDAYVTAPSAQHRQSALAQEEPIRPPVEGQTP